MKSKDTSMMLPIFAEPEAESRYAIRVGDLLDVLPTLPENHFDGVLCDPPYHLTQKSRRGSTRKANEDDCG